MVDPETTWSADDEAYARAHTNPETATSEDAPGAPISPAQDAGARSRLDLPRTADEAIFAAAGAFSEALDQPELENAATCYLRCMAILALYDFVKDNDL